MRGSACGQKQIKTHQAYAVDLLLCDCMHMSKADMLGCSTFIAVYTQPPKQVGSQCVVHANLLSDSLQGRPNAMCPCALASCNILLAVDKPCDGRTWCV